jgi:hypothetical protein
MAESWFALNQADRVEAVEYAAAQSGRPAHLLEKDIWVVWTLSAIYASPIADTLTFKGGTSLSKVYKVIDRFSEDIDLTYDIRALVPDLLREGNPIPASMSQEKKITRAVRARLPEWIEQTVRPVIEDALAASGLQADLSLAGQERDKLIIAYPAVKTGTGYVSATVQLEFGARATGEPHHFHEVVCDIAPWIEGVTLPHVEDGTPGLAKQRLDIPATRWRPDARNATPPVTCAECSHSPASIPPTTTAWITSRLRAALQRCPGASGPTSPAFIWRSP